ncbi:FadR/GntR family transcriptional regulator [Pseudooceanicola sp. C21-150M6]|uniref:FadR/GntR family transcriptional regulator n=1 Tax=Pseudooceanicola sp. C21-150M6 TaxID=3434355 RepID=UPI003D7F6F37
MTEDSQILTASSLRHRKRGDLVVGEIKAWISDRALSPGDRLPKEAELQEIFGVSRGVIREALKVLEVQGLVTLSTGPKGGARLEVPPFDRTFRFVQNYLFFQGLSVADIYEQRLLIEPELAAGAVPYLTEDNFAMMERSIELSATDAAPDSEEAMRSRQEDLNFHDVFARSNPNSMLSFTGQMINETLRTVVEISWAESAEHYGEFGRSNAEAHRRILSACRAGDRDQVRDEMRLHILEVRDFVLNRMNAEIRSELLDDDGMHVRVNIGRRR